jgi:hypothetical protein
MHRIHACVPGADSPSGDGVDVTLVDGRGERLVVFPLRAPNTQPRPLVVAGRDEPGDCPATLGDRDRFPLGVNPINEREALGLELSGGDGLQVTRLNDQFGHRQLRSGVRLIASRGSRAEADRLNAQLLRLRAPGADARSGETSPEPVG